MDKYTPDRQAHDAYSLSKLQSKRKNEISPWSFYQDNTQTKNPIEELPIEKHSEQVVKKPRKAKSNKSSSGGKYLAKKRSPTSIEEQNPETDKKEESRKMFEEMRGVSKQISELLRERIILRAVMKYMDLSNALAKQKQPPKEPSTKRSVAQINIHVPIEHEQSKQLRRRSEQKAFNDIQMQIHSIPPELKVKTGRRPSGLIKVPRDYEGGYADYNFKHSIEVSGSKKLFSLKES